MAWRPSEWVLEGEQPSVRMLLVEQLHAELDMKHRLTQLPLDLRVVHLGVVEGNSAALRMARAWGS